MNKNLGKIAAVIVIAGALLYSLYLMITSEENLLDSLRIFMPMLCSSFILLSHVFSTKQIQPLPKNLLENEEYIEAKERQDSGGKIFVMGILMMGIPFALLLVLGELHDFLASLCLISFILGILVILMGLIVVFGAGKDLSKFPVEMVQEPQPESIVSRVFNALSGLALLVWIALWLLNTMNII